MIVDSHAYCFLSAGSDRGYSSGSEHLRWVQSSHANHHQPAFRVNDRVEGLSNVLAPYGRDLENLPDLGFRVDTERGRVAWEYQGEQYTKHFYPPNLYDCKFSPHSLIGEMDYAGVDVALLHTDPMLVRDSTYLAECIALYPERLIAMAPVDEWRLRDEPDKVIEEVVTAVKVNGLHAIKFNPLGYMVSNEAWDGGFYSSFWDAVTGLGVPIFFTLGTGPESPSIVPGIQGGRDGYIKELHILMRWMERYPDTICSLTHGFPWRTFLEEDRIVLPPDVWEPFKGDNCNLELCFPVRIGDIFDFPYSEVWPTVAEMVRNIGADHLLWGTDMPFQNRFCTYRQSRKWIEKFCDFLGDDELDLIMGQTASRILGIKSL